MRRKFLEFHIKEGKRSNPILRKTIEHFKSTSTKMFVKSDEDKNV